MSNAGSNSTKKRTIMRSLQINEISGVDVPAQEGALAVIMKRHSDEDAAPQTGQLVQKGSALTSSVEGHAHLICLNGPPDGVEMNAGETSYQDGHYHPWIRSESGEIVIGEAKSMDGMAHTHEVSVLSKAKDDDKPKKKPEPGAGNPEDALEDEADEGKDDEKPKKSDAKKSIEGDNPASPSEEDAGQTVEGENALGKSDVGEQEDQSMTDKTVEELQKQLDRANSVAALNDAEKAYFGGLEDAAQDSFLAKSANDRKVEMDEAVAKAAEADPVAYTTEAGIEIRKSAGEAVIALAKQADALVKENAELREGREADSLEKRAEELAHIPGDLGTRISMLKAIDGIEDEEVREDALKALKAQNESLAKAFETAGVAGSPAAPTSDEAELETLAKAYAEKHNMTFEAAYSKVLESPEGSALYAKSVH